MDPLQAGFIATIVRYGIIIAVILAAASQVGINITSLIAVFGAAALAIGLAVKDNLSNFSSGMLLVFFRPFTKGDFVEVSSATGTIEATNLFSTVLNTADNKKVFIPNSLVMNNIITNYSANPTRRLDLSIGIDYNADIITAKKTLLTILETHPVIRSTPEPVVAVEALADSSVNITVRAWVPTAQYLSTKFELLEESKNALTEQGISIPFPQMDIHMDK
jgi:small conductance mechanosensitive channel